VLKIVYMLILVSIFPLQTQGAEMAEIYTIPVTTITGEVQKLDDYSDKVILIVNVASKCGFTRQYDGLEKLYKKYKEKGFVVLGFPCNQFGGQEPGTNTEIANFCRLNYGVSFPMFAKIDVNGENAHPLYVYLRKTLPAGKENGDIQWNFTKFLVDKNGVVKHRFPSSVTPAEIEDEIEKLL